MPDRPNIIVLICDQMRPFELGCYGHETVLTPNLDRMAREGARFEHAISNAPVCTPARSCLLSGQHARTCVGTLRNTASDLPENRRIRFPDPTMAECLQQLGYSTAVIGKWHIYQDPISVGFDHALYPLVYEHLSRQIYIDSETGPRIVEKFGPQFEADRVDAFLENSGRTPFFLLYSLVPPHMPVLDAPESYTRMYTRDQVELRPNLCRDGRLPFSEWDFNVYLYNLFDERVLPADFDVHDLTALYWGMVSCVDDNLGHLMRTLSRLRLDDNTIVIFIADHGDNLGSHHLWHKGTMNEESIRIPFLCRAPGLIEPRSVTRQVAQLIDVMPTVLDFAGAATPDPVQGRSLASILTGDAEALAEDYAFTEMSGWSAVRTPRFKYGANRTDLVRGRPPESARFYDLGEDPLELTNLARSHSAQPECEVQRKRLETWNAVTPWLRIGLDGRRAMT